MLASLLCVTFIWSIKAITGKSKGEFTSKNLLDEVNSNFPVLTGSVQQISTE